MARKSLHLSKILKFYGSADNHLISSLRTELRRERDRLGESVSGGRDFYGPFWSDAKTHVLGVAHLEALTQLRVEDSKQRATLYPALCKGFLEWLDGLKRSTNQSVGWSELRFHNHVEIDDLDLEVKVDNLLTIKFGEGAHRLVYPYFAKAPPLSEKWARVGLWMMSEAFPDQSIVEMEILDVLRGKGFRGAQIGLKGDEEFLFRERYKAITKEWDDLRPHYGL